MLELEVIVVDAGCKDGTMARVAKVVEELAARPSGDALTSFAIRTVRSRGGRGPALNTGMLEASGDVLLMLHAGTMLPRGWDRHVMGALINPEVT